MVAVGVLGGGHQGYAVAGDLAAAGHRVRLWRRTAESFGSLAHDPTITVLRGQDARTGVLAGVSGDLAATVHDAEVVIVAVPAHAHPSLMAALAPVLPADATVLLTPGNLGTLELAAALAREGRTDVVAAETPHPPYGVRKRDDRTVAIAHPTIRLPVGVLPGGEATAGRQLLGDLFPQLLDAQDVLDAALCNPNPTIHPALMVANAGAVESFDRYDIHASGTTPATRRIIDAIDAERIVLRETLGYRAPHWDVGTLYDNDRRGTGFFPPETFSTVTASGDWNEPLSLTDHRYVLEDAGRGLAAWLALGRLAGVAMPVSEAVIDSLAVLSDSELDSAGALSVVDADLPRLQRIVSQGWQG